ncbi:MAG: hypothetical protein MJE77_11170, partial [Proteobacteria bacterium]|nr:hypothetical protein [Pseudomonadota bacterium]
MNSNRRLVLLCSLLAVLAMTTCIDLARVPCGDGYCLVGYRCERIKDRSQCVKPGTCGNTMVDHHLGEQCDTKLLVTASCIAFRYDTATLTKMDPLLLSKMEPGGESVLSRFWGLGAEAATSCQPSHWWS